MLGLTASRDLDFPSLPLLVGLRFGKRNGDPLGVGLEVFEADSSQFRPLQPSREPDQDQGPVPGYGQGTALRDKRVFCFHWSRNTNNSLYDNSLGIPYQDHREQSELHQS